MASAEAQTNEAEIFLKLFSAVKLGEQTEKFSTVETGQFLHHTAKGAGDARSDSQLLKARRKITYKALIRFSTICEDCFSKARRRLLFVRLARLVLFGSATASSTTLLAPLKTASALDPILAASICLLSSSLGIAIEILNSSVLGKTSLEDSFLELSQLRGEALQLQLEFDAWHELDFQDGPSEAILRRANNFFRQVLEIKGTILSLSRSNQ